MFEFLNQPFVLTILIGLILMGLNRLFTAKPLWKTYLDAYGPYALRAVKFAEKLIPEDAPNKGAQRLDVALQFTLGLIEKAKGPYEAGKLDEEELRKAITRTHAELEAAGSLEPATIPGVAIDLNDETRIMPVPSRN